MINKLLNFIGLTRKSGNIIIGSNLVETALNKNKVRVIIVTKDASENTRDKIMSLAKRKNVKVINTLYKEDLGYALGKSEISVAGVTDARMAEVISDLSGESLLK